MPCRGLKNNPLHIDMKKILYTCSAFCFLTLPLRVFAEGSPDPVQLNVRIDNPFKGGDDLSAVVVAILNDIIMPLAGVLVVLAIIYSGFKYVTAQGKPEEIKKANQGLLYVLIGTLILLGAGAIAAAIKGTLTQLMAF